MKVLFLINGLGLGNSTRCHAIMQCLSKLQATIEVVTSGNGFWYFADKSEVQKIHRTSPLHYGAKDGAISISRTVVSVNRMIKTLKQNTAIVDRVLDSFQPNVVVTDSEYIFRPMKKKGIPIVALNNADLVWWNYYRFRDAPASVKAQFYCVECVDKLYHRMVPDLILSPALGPTPPPDRGNVIHVGPIVRRGYDVPDPNREEQCAAIMLSGSNFATKVIRQQQMPDIAIDVIGRDAPEDLPAMEGVTFHGKISDTLPLLAKAKVVVVNGGFSAVSEIFCLGKPAIIVPVPRHAEQWANAREIAFLGVGLFGNEQSYFQSLMELYDNYDRYRAAFDALPPPRKGAQEASTAIANIIN